MAAIGIDLGTTYSCVAVLQSKKGKKANVEIIQNDMGNRTTPSWVAFAGKETLIGEAAQLQMMRNPKNTIFGIKRIIGRPFADAVVQEHKKKVDYDIVSDNVKTKVKVTENERNRSLFPEEISAMVLTHMKKVAEGFIGGTVHSAVITVPAYFNNSQRSATKDAAAIADLHVLGVINEPTAAAIAYGLQRKFSSKRNILVFDLGGGTFDVTLMSIEGGLFDVKATAGDTHLGGEDFTENLSAHLAAEFKRVHHKDLTTSPRARYRLMKECEQIKRHLSAANLTRESVFIDQIFEGIDLDTQVTRATFERLNENLFNRTITLVDQVLSDAEMKKNEVHEIVLVGGSTRIPFIQEVLEREFGEGKVLKTINADEAVAYGAAVHAAFLSGDVNAQMMDGAKIDLRDVTPLSLGTCVGGDKMSVVIKRNAKIPTKANKTYRTRPMPYTSVNIEIYEGEGEKCAENNHLGNVTLGGLSSISAEEVRIEVCFELDKNGVLKVSVTDETKKISESITITMDSARMTEEEIKNLILQANMRRIQDDSSKGTNKALNDLEAHVNDVKTRVNRWRISPGSRESTNKDALLLKCKTLLEWISQNQNAPVKDVLEEEKNLNTMFSVLSLSPE